MTKKRQMRRVRKGTVLLALVVAGYGFAGALVCAAAQQAQTVVQTGSPAANAAEVISLDEAIRRAKGIDTTFAAAVAESKVAESQKKIAGAGLLPGVVYHNQFLYTQPQSLNGRPIPNSTGVFIANNGVHEYISQGSVTETVGAAGIADLKRLSAEAIAAKARLEVARRGLVASVVNLYYGVLNADAKVLVAERALDEAKHFQTLSSELEKGGEVAHADVVKSDLEVEQRERDLSDAQLTAEQTRLELGVLLFADPRTRFTLPADLNTMTAMPTKEQMDAAAKNGNPDVRAALASFQASQFEVTASRLAYLPSLSLNYSYGIDANQFANHAPDGTRNLGYAAYATLDIPVWDWFATHNLVKQGLARREQAKVELNNTQRRLLASIEALYREAEVARSDAMSLDTSVRDAKESLRLTDLRYRSGEATILEVVDAQATVIAVEDSRADAAARYEAALANLQTLTGNLP
jgi:outer membrane protein TolC